MVIEFLIWGLHYKRIGLTHSTLSPQKQLLSRMFVTNLPSKHSSWSKSTVSQSPPLRTRSFVYQIGSFANATANQSLDGNATFFLEPGTSCRCFEFISLIDRPPPAKTRRTKKLSQTPISRFYSICHCPTTFSSLQFYPSRVPVKMESNKTCDLYTQPTGLESVRFDGRRHGSTRSGSLACKVQTARSFRRTSNILFTNARRFSWQL